MSAQHQTQPAGKAGDGKLKQPPSVEQTPELLTDWLSSVATLQRVSTDPQSLTSIEARRLQQGLGNQALQSVANTMHNPLQMISQNNYGAAKSSLQSKLVNQQQVSEIVQTAHILATPIQRISNGVIAFPQIGSDYFRYGSKLIQRQTATHPDPDCNDLLAQIIARIAELKARADALIRDPLKLPQSGPMSIDGHQQQFRNKQVNLRRKLLDWDTDGCGPGYLPTDAWQWATRLAPKPAPQSNSSHRNAEPPRDGSDITAGDVAIVAGAAATGYLIYRAIRLLPSLLPPLWWTLPANAAIP